YDTARLTNLNNEVELLSSIAPYIAEDVTRDLQEGNSWNTTIEPADNKQVANIIYLFLADRQHNLLAQPDNPSIGHIYSDIVNRQQAGPSVNAGSLSVNKRVYVWAAVDIASNNNQLFLIRQAHVSQANAFFREMGLSLVIAAAIILWIASWAAMYISMLIEKLDEQKKVLKHRTLHDVLTGLPNRALLHDRLNQLVALSDRQPIPFAICFIDLNRFKDVNDTLGHHVGDELLLEISRRLQLNLRKSDTIARLGGDEFALILRNVREEKARSIVRKVVSAIEEPVEAGGHRLFVSGSIGIALFPEHGNDVHILLKKADVAMYAAKRAGSNMEFYSDNDDEFTRDKLSLIHDLHEAIQQDQLDIHYQPKYDINKQRIIGVEALLRWKHPIHGDIPPLMFIQLAEHSGLIHSISRWVMQRAFSDSVKLKRKGIDISVSINLSAYYLQDLRFESDISELIETPNVDNSRIIFELTESAMVVNSTKTKTLMRWLTEKGFRISIDDFGTGYSTLTNLRRLPISELKIDRSFVSNIPADTEDASIVTAMIGLGSSLDIDVVAEGVETEEVLSLLKQSGCSIIQGNLIRNPLPLDALIEWMNSETQPVPLVRSAAN
ncbi:MAG: EAL domain-containing protein, partial [Gammaproteobacteria bacterium]